MHAEVPAGRYAAWAVSTAAAIRGERDAEVPCGSCTACCTSSQFVHVAPDELDTLAHLPAEVLVPAPGLPAGHRVMGYDEHGRCPMFRDGGCSIYEHRPRTCRTYDCRVFPATGVAVAPEQPQIAARAAHWRFEVLDDEDLRRRAAVHGAVRSLREQVAARGGPGPNPTQLAARAVEVHETFLAPPRRRGAGSAPQLPT
jgi:Fe-S-cluster containining protein